MSRVVYRENGSTFVQLSRHFGDFCAVSGI